MQTIFCHTKSFKQHIISVYGPVSIITTHIVQYVYFRSGTCVFRSRVNAVRHIGNQLRENDVFIGLKYLKVHL